jgi:hypothetical protein
MCEQKSNTWNLQRKRYKAQLLFFIKKKKKWRLKGKRLHYCDEKTHEISEILALKTHARRLYQTNHSHLADLGGHMQEQTCM